MTASVALLEIKFLADDSESLQSNPHKQPSCNACTSLARDLRPHLPEPFDCRRFVPKARVQTLRGAVLRTLDWSWRHPSRVSVKAASDWLFRSALHLKACSKSLTLSPISLEQEGRRDVHSFTILVISSSNTRHPSLSHSLRHE